MIRLIGRRIKPEGETRDASPLRGGLRASCMGLPHRSSPPQELPRTRLAPPDDERKQGRSEAKMRTNRVNQPVIMQPMG
jgi:hypothetical protein